MALKQFNRLGMNSTRSVASGIDTIPENDSPKQGYLLADREEAEW